MQSLEVLRDNLGPSLYRLRWFLEFAKKPSVRGAFDASNPEAWSVNKEGLLYAGIEAKDNATGAIFRILHCAGPDFFNFQWVQETDTLKNPTNGKITNGRARLVGLSLTDRDEVVTVFADGRIFKEPRQKDFKENIFKAGKE
jgi:hypothetical protein